MNIQKLKKFRDLLVCSLNILLLGAVIGTAPDAVADVIAGGSGDIGESSGFPPSAATYQRTDPTSWTTNTQAVIGFDTYTPAELRIDNAGSTHSVICGAQITGYGSSTFGKVTVSGSGASFTSSLSMIWGFNGVGLLYVTNGALVSVGGKTYLGFLTSSAGQVEVSGEGSLFATASDLVVGMGGLGIVRITDNGLVKASGVSINASSAVVLQSGGKLAIECDASVDTMTEFLDQISGNKSDSIRFWNGESYTNFTEGVDYAVYRGTGDLDGYAVLAEGIPEPSTVSLMGVVAMGLCGRLLLRRRS